MTDARTKNGLWTLLAISIIANIFLLVQWNNSRSDLLEFHKVGQQNAHLQNFHDKVLTLYMEEKDLFSDPQLRAIHIKSTDQSQSMGATLFWNKTGQELRFLSHKLPAPPSGMTYRLWSEKQQETVLIGTVPVEALTEGSVVSFPFERSLPDSFSLTLEPESETTTYPAHLAILKGDI